MYSVNVIVCEMKLQQSTCKQIEHNVVLNSLCKLSTRIMQCQEKLKMLIEQLRNPNDLDISLTMEFGPFETVHKWKRMSECYEFVGARRSKHTAVAYKDAIYVFGGDNGKSMLNDLIRFDIKEKSWTKMGCMGAPPAPRYHHSAVVYKTSMFVFGGYTGDILANSNLTNKNDLFEYKFPNAQWVQWKFTGQEPVPRSAHGAAVYDAKLWIFAGYDGNARLNDMWTIKLEGDNHQWERVEQKGQCPPTCCNFPVAVARGRMFVFSGQSGAKITNALFQFHFETHTWSRVCTEHLLRCAGPAPARRYGHVMLAHERHLYVFGGAADNTLPNDVHCYDLDTQMWSVVQTSSDSQVPSGRLFHAGAVVDDAMYIFGGTVDNNVRSGELFRFQLSNYPRCTLHDDFGAILKSQQFCDVTLLLGEKQEPIMAHQAMLAARSQFLKAKIKEARAELTKTLDENEHKSLDVDDIAVNEVTKSNSPEIEPDEDNEENIAFNKINDLTLNKMTTVEDKSPDTNKTTSDDETEIDIDDVNSNNRIYGIDNVNEVFKLVNSDYKALEANKVSAAEEIALERNKTKDVESPSDDHNEIAPKFSKIATYGQSKSDTPEVSIGVDVKNPATVDRSVKARLRKPKPLAPLTIAIPEASLDSFKMLLKYIYTDRIDPTEIDEDPASSSTMLLVIEVLRLALTLRIPRLAGLCARFLRAKLCCANVLAALSAAHNAKLDSIKEYCLRFVVKDYNFTPIVMSKDFEFIEQCLMVEIIRRRQQPVQKQAHTQSTEYDDDINGTTLEQDMCFFLTGGSGYELADVTLMVGKSARPAHRSVLAARAAFFEAMFRSFEPQDNIVNIQICDTVPSVESVDSLMRYIYYGDTNMPPEDSLYLFQAPVYYGFTNNRLQVFCQHNLHNSVTQENVLAILQAADRTRATDIKEYALDMVVHHFCKVSRQPAVRNLDQRILVDIVLAIADWIDSLKLETLPILPRSLRKSISAMTIMEDQDFKQGTSK